MNQFRQLHITPWTGDRPISVTLCTQDSTTQENAGIYPCF